MNYEVQDKPSTSPEVIPQPDWNKYYVGGERSDLPIFDQSIHPQAKIRDRSGLEVRPSTSPQVALQPDENKYYVGGGGSDPSVIDQSIQLQAKSKARPKAVWVFAITAVICLAIALGAGLGAGLAAQHKSSSTSSSSIPITVTKASNTPGTTTQASDISSITSSPPDQSGSPTSTPSSAPAAVSSASSPPSSLVKASNPSAPVQTSSNDKGSSLCSFIDGTTCQNAYAQYNDTYLYTAYTSYILPSGGNSGNDTLSPSADEGCAAIFTCNSYADYAVGMTGAQIKAAFGYMYQNDGTSDGVFLE
ncbi:MAG: hypothetical protein ASARMPRED_003556 [Alectoria sarmentosa]|nr:MAG: hypothetical protein ASARMPRED_003556 [Alectoria sarmentosa]